MYGSYGREFLFLEERRVYMRLERVIIFSHFSIRNSSITAIFVIYFHIIPNYNFFNSHSHSHFHEPNP